MICTITAGLVCRLVHISVWCTLSLNRIKHLISITHLPAANDGITAFGPPAHQHLLRSLIAERFPPCRRCWVCCVARVC